MALTDRVLLLNQTYEPLGTVSVARAIIMTFKDTRPPRTPVKTATDEHKLHRSRSVQIRVHPWLETLRM